MEPKTTKRERAYWETENYTIEQATQNLRKGLSIVKQKLDKVVFSWVLHAERLNDDQCVFLVSRVQSVSLHRRHPFFGSTQLPSVSWTKVYRFWTFRGVGMGIS